MLVYTNAFSVLGSDSSQACLRAIHGWFCQQLGHSPSIAEIQKAGMIEGKRGGKKSYLRTYAFYEDDGYRLAWRLKHGDERTPGRQWVIEIGLVIQGNDRTDFSVTVQTEELSTLVDAAVRASRPRLIGFILDNVNDAGDAEIDPSTPGVGIKRAGRNTDEFRALARVIEDAGRRSPLVLVSPTRDGQYFLNRRHLQEQLFGLAQVVEIHPDFNSNEMEQILGRWWSAWDGAVNVIRTRLPSGKVVGNVIRSYELQDQGDTQDSRIAHILRFVTHNTNIPRLRDHISPEEIARLATRARLDSRIRELEAAGADRSERDEELLNELIEAKADIERLRREREQAQLTVLAKEDEISDLQDQIRKERFRPRNASNEQGADQSDPQALKLAIELLADEQMPSPRAALQLIQTAFQDHVIVLDSAFDSADQSETFQHTKRLFNLLIRLVTEYRDRLQSEGDNAARQVFTPSEFAATESETILKSKELMRVRTFEYLGRPIPMSRHLKIGVADDVTKTIRVHFHWDSDSARIVIGYCGSHLPIAGH
jgi:hypothetical protein